MFAFKEKTEAQPHRCSPIQFLHHQRSH